MNDDKKVGMLLDISNFYGERDVRLTPIIKFLLIAGAPGLIWTYVGFPIPAIIFLPLWLVWTIRIAMIVLGREGDRLAQFRKQINDDYSAISELMNIKAVHADGCIEYADNSIAYLIIATNGTTYNATQRAQYIRDFLSLLGNDRDVDVYIQNLTETRSLEERYANVKLFTDAEAAQDFLDIIDHNRQVVYSQSLLTRIVFVVKGRRADWTDVRDNCKTAIYSASAKAFKEVRIALYDDVQDVLNTDIRGVVDLDSTLQRKYATHSYFNSRVLYFDEKPADVGAETLTEERGFMVTDG